MQSVDVMLYFAGIVMNRPIDAARFIFSTLTHSTIAAPELSMQFSIVLAFD
jgi:hypothetical protein